MTKDIRWVQSYRHFVKGLDLQSSALNLIPKPYTET